VANYSSDNVSVLLNNGNGTFQNAVNYDAGDGPRSVYTCDLDGDSNSDLTVANFRSDNVSVLLNNGNGTFQNAVNYGAGDGPRSVYACDLDGDSDADLAVAAHNVYVLLNNGDGTFQTAVNYGAGDGPYSIYACDIDGDSDTDLAVANRWSDNISILFNTTSSTGIKEFENRRIPIGFFLTQNYPNPFNSGTTIEFSLSKMEYVTLKIINILGQEVTTLVSEILEPGNYRSSWNAGSLASGVYLYQLQIADHMETKKMILMK
jgi:hypothetical protein